MTDLNAEHLAFPISFAPLHFLKTKQWLHDALLPARGYNNPVQHHHNSNTLFPMEQRRRVCNKV